ncbi:Hypothetical predicted protein [Scomber scombrus]|uniref:Uncharacterized protein n=1 Tax=Scomber scombrus TaxID=13677 RepID=A0AAV1NU25_SCOSC
MEEGTRRKDRKRGQNQEKRGVKQIEMNFNKRTGASKGGGGEEEMEGAQSDWYCKFHPLDTKGHKVPLQICISSEVRGQSVTEAPVEQSVSCLITSAIPSNHITAAASHVQILIQLSNIIRLTCELCFSLDFCFDEEITDSLMTTDDAHGQLEVAGEIF